LDGFVIERPLMELQHMLENNLSHNVDFTKPGVYEVTFEYHWVYTGDFFDRDMILSFSFYVQVIDKETFFDHLHDQDEEDGLESTDDMEANRGVIYGEIYFNGIAISRLFKEPFIDVLGEPLGSRDEMWFFYEGLQINAVGYGGEVMQLDVFEPYLSMFEIGGISLDGMTKEKFISTFGTPYQTFFDDNSLRYFISTDEIRYFLILRFENPDDDTRFTGFTIF
jgi:hypothetical protein